MKLSATNIGTLGPGDYRDDGEVRRLFLRVRPSGARSWALRYYRNGRDVRLTLGLVKVKPNDEGLTLKAARNRALAILARVADGADPQAERQAARAAERLPKVERVTVRALTTEALKHLKLRPRSVQQYEGIMRLHVHPVMGDRDADDVTRRDIRAWVEKLSEAAPVSARRSYAVLRRCWSLAVERDLVASSPFANLRPPDVKSASDRVLTAPELWALQRALNELADGEDLVDSVRLLLLTCVRRQNVLGAHRGEFHDLDGRDPRWILAAERMKGARLHIVPLSKQAGDIVRARLEDGRSYLFGDGEGRGFQAFVPRLRNRVDRILGKLGPAPPWVIHNLRHTAGTHMREDLSIRRDVVSLILAHKVTDGARVTEVYDRAPLLADRREALAEWATWLDQLPEPGKVLSWGRTGDGNP